MRQAMMVGGFLAIAAIGCSSTSDGGAKAQSSGDDTVVLKERCGPDDIEPDPGELTGPACSSYVTPTADGAGTETKFGPYGAIMEPNVGQGYEITPNAQDTKEFCDNFGKSFGEDPDLTAQVMDLRGTDLHLYTVFRPAKWKDGEKYPILTWGNGTCAQPGSYAALLMHAASYGFFVVAANGRFVADGSQVKALDFVFAANEDPSSPYYHRLDTDHVGAFGHSQGSAATISASTDPRVTASILFNGGVTASKPYLAFSGDRDIGAPSVQHYADGIAAATVPSAFVFFHQVPMTGGAFTGHLTLMMEPNRVVQAATGWWQYRFQGDAQAKALFVGDGCGLCGQDDQFEYGEHALD